MLLLHPTRRGSGRVNCRMAQPLTTSLFGVKMKAGAGGALHQHSYSRRGMAEGLWCKEELPGDPHTLSQPPAASHRRPRQSKRGSHTSQVMCRQHCCLHMIGTFPDKATHNRLQRYACKWVAHPFPTLATQPASRSTRQTYRGWRRTPPLTPPPHPKAFN